MFLYLFVQQRTVWVWISFAFSAGVIDLFTTFSWQLEESSGKKVQLIYQCFYSVIVKVTFTGLPTAPTSSLFLNTTPLCFTDEWQQS